MSLEFGHGQIIQVVPPALPVIEAAPPPSPPLVVVPVIGPPGPPGPVGDPFVDWFTGHGPPGVVVGAGRGDMYVDLDTGTLYQLS